MDTPKPQKGKWTLTAPDGRKWVADTPLKCVGSEQRERIPPSVALEKISSLVEQETSLTKPPNKAELKESLRDANDHIRSLDAEILRVKNIARMYVHESSETSLEMALRAA